MAVETGKLLAYLVLFFIGYQLIGDKARLRRLGFAVIGIGCIVSLVGLLFFRFSPNRVYGLIGLEHLSPFTPYFNKNHFANYLVMTLPVTLATCFLLGDRSSLPRLRSFREKVLWLGSREATGLWVLVVGFAIQLAAFLCAASRGGLAGLVAAFGGFVALIVLKGRNRKMPLILLGLVALGLAWGVSEAHPLLHKLRLLGESPTHDYAIQFRLSNWKDTFRMFLDFPAVGIGAGGFTELFPLYKTMPEKSIFSQVRFYYTENELLQGLAELGLVGMGLLIAFGAMLASGFLRQWARASSKTVHWMALGFGCSLVGMLVHALVDFPTHLPANMALASVLGGVLARLRAEEPFPEGRTEKGSGGGFGQILGVFLKGVLAVLLLAVVVPHLLGQWRSDQYYLRAEKKLDQMRQNASISLPPLLAAYEDLLTARRWGENQARIHQSLGSVYTYLGVLAQARPKQREAWFRQAEASLLKAARLAPLWAHHHYSLGWLYQEWDRREQASYHLEHATLLAPRNPFFHFQLGANELALDRFGSALGSFREALTINEAFLRPVLGLLAVREVTTPLGYLDDLLPQSDRREILQDEAANFFASRQDMKTAAATGERINLPQQIR